MTPSTGERWPAGDSCGGALACADRADGEEPPGHSVGLLPAAAVPTVPEHKRVRQSGKDINPPPRKLPPASGGYSTTFCIVLSSYVCDGAMLADVCGAARTSPAARRPGSAQPGPAQPSSPDRSGQNARVLGQERRLGGRKTLIFGSKTVIPGPGVQNTV